MQKRTVNNSQSLSSGNLELLSNTVFINKFDQGLICESQTYRLIQLAMSNSMKRYFEKLTLV